jgi:glyoxylase-like metal-dependent hydrolase (beta-lactamase superfamily II)
VAQDQPVFKVTQLTENIYQLISDQGSYTTNVIVSVGSDGILLVDTDHEENAEDLKKVIDSFGKGIPKYIINTHRHVEHVGGNAIFGKSPVIIAHDLVRSKLKSGSYLFYEFPEETMPDITLVDSLSLYFNGEKIRLIALAGSHDDNEIIIHFTGSKVVHLSSLINGLNFPSVDSDGDVLKFEETVSRAVELLPEDVTIVSGHNKNRTWQDLHAYRDMIIETTEIVRNGLAAGKDVATLQKEKVLAGYEAYAESYVSPDDWISYLANGIEKKEPKKKIYEPIFYALKDKGVSAALDVYDDLKTNYSDEYIIEDAYLLNIGSILLTKERTEEAAEFLKLCVNEFPDGTYAYYTNYILSNAYKELGNKDLAIKHCQKAIDLKSDFESAIKLLEELKGM